MKYRKLGTSDLQASVIAFGSWGAGGGSVWSDRTLSAADLSRLLDAAEDRGINYIDTAPVYGTGASEQLLGEALKGRRDRFILQTKCSLNWRGEGGNFHYQRDGYTVNNDTRPRAVRKDVEDSLRRLKTDMIDVIVVHYVCSSWPAAETMGALMELVKEGKIRAVGLSNSRPADLEEYRQYGSVALVQEQYSLLAPYHGMEYFPAAKKCSVTFQVYGALEEGFLTSPDFVERSFPKGDIRGRLPWNAEPIKGKVSEMFRRIAPLTEKYGCSFANLVQAWTLKQYPDLSLLTGFRRVETIADTLRCLDIPLTDEDAALMWEAALPAQVREIDK